MDAADHKFMAQLVRSVTDACRVPSGEEVRPGVSNELAFTVVRPAGKAGYPAIWVQDFTMIFSGGHLSHNEGLNHLRLFLQCQNGNQRRDLQNGAWIPPHAIPDHVRFDGKPVFFPGTYSADDDQGGEPWGITPPFNNPYDLIWLAHSLRTRPGTSDFLREEVDGTSVYARLQKAYQVPTTDPHTGLVVTRAEERAVGFIFCDSIYMTGALLMPSLLRIRASRQMADLATFLGRDADAELYSEQAGQTAQHLSDTFVCEGDVGVWLQASTGISCQPDVWGSIYAVYLNVLPPDTRSAVLLELVNALRKGTIEWEGALRHVPLDRDASEQSAWERTPTPHNRYQNGAYWHMPTGWLISVLSTAYPDWAKEVEDRFLDHMRKYAFTKGEPFGAPWECIGWGGQARQNPIFGPSITVPYSTLMGPQDKRGPNYN
ncbi:MAG: hypothetical protein U1E27_07795 [Kiritimatiellia bacterium]|nr:hypothetical protein [Kiritimatiellia bacterium]